MTWGWLEIGSALWLGILTSISPCPLATNIAAITYVGRRVEKPRLVLFAGLLYTLGRTLAYVAAAIIVTRSMQMIPGVSMFLQKYISLAIGPLLVAVGVLLLGIFNVVFGGGMGGSLQGKVDKMGIWGAGLLGIVFALAFCPVSAGLFFGALIPLAVKSNAVLMSTLYGIGTAVPVIGFSHLLAFAAHLIGATFKKLTAIELWVRRVTAVAMILIGFYLIVRHNFGVNI
ncbi:MAG: sulfite exporter TauE/SafE family protein [Chitinispirillaceae bacterium]|nr:sulfite exporter TauE/SafE family protein [Chitinispirillaceae bacterium]